MGVPNGQIDHNLGQVNCPKCGQANYKGAYICGHGACDGQLPKIKLKTSTERQPNINMDYSKLTPQDIEAMSQTKDHYRMKRQGFERRMDRVNKALRNANSSSDVQKYQRIKKQTLVSYNKYNSSNLKS